MPRSWRGRLQRLHAFGLALLLVAGLLVPALGTPVSAQDPGTDPVSILTFYEIVQGDAGGLRLGDPITRAEVAVAAVKALGLRQEAELLKDALAFPDMKGHWATGEVAVATRLGLLKGYPDGTFKPKNNVTYAEMLTIFLRMVNQEPTTGTWPQNVLDKAAALKINPPGISLNAVAGIPAIRGHVFHSLGTAVSTLPYTADGRTILQERIDRTPPEVTLATLPAQTPEASVTVSGTAKDAVRVTVNGKPVSLVNSTYRTTVDLQAGGNTIKVEAFDMAGNKATAQAQVVRAVEIVRIEVSGPSTVDAGKTAQYTVTGYDRSGIAVGTTGLTASVTGGIGTFNLSTGVLTAANHGASGQIVITGGAVTKTVDVRVVGPAAGAAQVRVVPPNAQNMAEQDRSTQIQVEVVDASGNRLTHDNGRVVVLSFSGLTGFSVSPASATTQNGVATFTVRGTNPGTVKLRPTSNGLQTVEYSLLVASPVRVKLVATPAKLIPDGWSTSTISAVLVDAQGNEVRNDTNADVVVKLSQSGSDGTITTNTVTIRRTTASSSFNGTFRAGTQNDVTATISGEVISGQPYTVDPVNIRIHQPTLADARILEVRGPGSTWEPFEEATFTIEVTDEEGMLITDGSVAFQVQVSTSNNEPLVDGLPDGLEVWIEGNPDLVPVRGAKDAVTARTTAGSARITVRYNKSGTVTMKAVPMGSTSSAYDNDGDRGSASSSLGLTADEAYAIYKAPVAGLRLTVDSPLGNNQTLGAVRNSTSSRFTLRAMTVDADGNWVPDERFEVTFARVGAEDVTSCPDSKPVRLRDGIAEVTCTGTADGIGADVFEATGSSYTSNEVTVEVQDEKPDASSSVEIWAIRGATKSGDTYLAGENNFVAPNNDYMEIELDGGQGLAAIRLYREGSSSILYTTDAVDLSSGAPKVWVPKSALPKGSYRYRVVAVNAVGSTGYSGYSETVTNADYTTSIYITKAQYNAANDTLTITGRGFHNDATWTPSLLVIKGPNGATQDLGSPEEIKHVSSSTVTIKLNAAAAANLENPEVFYGSVTLDAQGGWYKRGADWAAPDTGNPATPFANVTAVLFDKTNNKLILTGAGFNGGTLDTSKLEVRGSGDPQSLSGMSATRNSDSQYTISLTSAVANNLKSKSNLDLAATAEGWFKDGSHLNAMLAGDIQVYIKVSVSGANYYKGDKKLVISGSGFAGGDIDVTKINVWPDSSESSAIPIALDTTKGETPTKGYDITGSSITLWVNDDTHDALKDLSGSSIYLVADDNWFDDDQGLPALGFEYRKVRLSIRS